ncbi:MAG: MraY family glycosyltransferase [Desulfomonilaceae bacterium]
MTSTWFLWMGVALFGFVATLVSIPRIRNYALKLKFVDCPGGRKHHCEPVPLLGGIAIICPLLCVILFAYCINALGGELFARPLNVQVLSLLLGTAWIHLLGTMDDMHGISWAKKIVGQLAGIGILVLSGYSVEGAAIPWIGPVNFGWWGIPIFALIVLVMTNAINLIDGLDGFAAGVCLFVSLTCGVVGLAKGQFFSAMVAFALFGSLLAFLRFNFPPATIYMGDGGSLPLGFFLSALACGSITIGPGQRSGTMAVFIAPFLPFGIALLDIFLAVARRWISGRRIYLPDAEHIHHRLMASFRRPRLVVGILYLFTGMLSIISILLALGPHLFVHIGLLVAVLIVTGTVGLLKLYRIDHLSTTIHNRPHLQFLDSFRSFMGRRIARSESTEDLMSLLESGVRDLKFDLVEVNSHDRIVRQWSAEFKVHPDSDRTTEIKRFQHNGVAVRWTMPTHDSHTYQDCLSETWYHFLNEIEARHLLLTAGNGDSFGRARYQPRVKHAG